MEVNHEKHAPPLGEALDLIRLLEDQCRDLRAGGQIAIEAEFAEIEAIIKQVRDELNGIIRRNY